MGKGFDKNTLIGLLLIGLILIGYSIYIQPSKEEIEKYSRQRDSLAALEMRNAEAESQVAADSAAITQTATDSSRVHPGPVLSDSLRRNEHLLKYGRFAAAASGEKRYFTIENEKIRITLCNLGGRITSVELKEYKTYTGGPLLLFDEDSSRFGVNFFDNNLFISTHDLFFEPVGQSFFSEKEDSGSFTMRLNAGSSGKHIDFVYTLKGGSYTAGFNIVLTGLEDMIHANTGELGLNWQMYVPSKEKHKESEQYTTTFFFKYEGDEVDYISERSDEKLQMEAKAKWIAFKQQYFSAVVIAGGYFDKVNAQLETKTVQDVTSPYTRFLAANLTLVLDKGQDPAFPMQLFFGPNHYQTLKRLEIDAQDQIDLGWGIFGWVNEFLVIPIFNFLERFNINYGVIILILTIIIKIILLPITYRNYLSSAKMKVLKPEIDELNERHKNEDPLKKQQALMALYKKAGVNPLAGCIPMLLQLPILYAMFRFFPASIELRQEPFLWAEDLSSYDSILDLGFSIPFYGDHVSLFTLLMAVSTFLYTKFTAMPAMEGPQAAQMKIMTYMMPVMLLFFFNSYSSALSYYYFSANVISILQQMAIKRWMINEEEIHRKIQEHKKKPVKKSKFQQRLEEMARQRIQQKRK